MATAVIMPRQGQSVESCIISKWYKKKGDAVSPGDILFSYETDKAAFEEDAKAEGVILGVFFEEGDEVECLKTVCVIGAEGESIDEFENQGPALETPRPDSGPVQASSAGSGEINAPISSDNITAADSLTISDSAYPPSYLSALTGYDTARVSPRAKALAEKSGADVSRAIPTGANSRVIERDVRKVIEEGYISTRAVRGDISGVSGTGLGGRVTTRDAAERRVSAYDRDDSAHRTTEQGAFLAATPAASDADFEEVKLSNVRKFIAKAMHASLSDSAQLTNHSSFDATDVLGFRKSLKSVEGRGDLARITVTDIIVYAVSRVLLSHKSLNAHFLGDRMALYSNTHIGVAVDTPRGLLVPTIMNANLMTLTEISTESKALIEKCKQGSIAPHQLKGASFTISNLGGFGIEMFTPILNPPQTGLLGVCCVVERTRNGVPYPAMGLSLTYDHRAVDGADAARFQKDLTVYLESFSANLLLEGGV